MKYCFNFYTFRSWHNESMYMFACHATFCPKYLQNFERKLEYSNGQLLIFRRLNIIQKSQKTFYNL